MLVDIMKAKVIAIAAVITTVITVVLAIMFLVMVNCLGAELPGPIHLY